ncbi:SCO family protein [Candidatus Aalborgicola defluviihabitans]|uniref:SCO family protein n=1 Tax=Candidatus Aalborgicola defluviihabitans TaxID=3386187 RepID=UPI0039B87969
MPRRLPHYHGRVGRIKRTWVRDGDRLQVLFVTVDPARDTPDVLKGYMANFDPYLPRFTRHRDKLAGVGQNTRFTSRRSMAKPHQLHNGPLGR